MSLLASNCTRSRLFAKIASLAWWAKVALLWHCQICPFSVSALRARIVCGVGCPWRAIVTNRTIQRNDNTHGRAGLPGRTSTAISIRCSSLVWIVSPDRTLLWCRQGGRTALNVERPVFHRLARDY